MADAQVTIDPIKKAYDEGYAAGWTAYGDLMIEQLGPDGMVWRGMDSAPDDGTEILVEHRNIGLMVVLYDMGGWREKANFLMLKDAPERWMPLPKPPR